MLKHNEFLPAIAEAFGESLNTVKLVHRLLREADLLAGQRGRHAPHRSSQDAAAFLCWIGVTDKPSEAPCAYRDFGLSSKLGSQPFGVEHPLSVLGLPATHTLIDVLAALLDAEASGVEFPSTGYKIEFAADELNVRIDFGVVGAIYGREGDPDEADYLKRYGRPYRVVRTFPRPFMQRVAALFAETPDHEEAQAA